MQASKPSVEHAAETAGNVPGPLVLAPRWTPPTGTLAALCASARDRVEALRPRAGELERAAPVSGAVSEFAGSLRRETVAVIAEIKRASPSKGAIAPGLDASAQAKAYAQGGAAALSVLTEPTRFGGSVEDLDHARDATAGAVPLLRKDFIVDRLQIVEARAHLASAVLLIARALEPALMRELARESVALGLHVLAEVRDEWELETALESGAAVIGVNNRNLETLAIDLATGERLVPLIPTDRVAVFESGVSTPEDVRRAAQAGADAVLVGSSLSEAPDPAAAVAALAREPRRGRA